MARIVPDDWKSLAATGAAARERETLALLEEALPADYTVYHGVHWTRLNQNFSVFGEADFVIVSPAGRVMIVEQKTGFLRETPKGLVKVYLQTERNVAIALAHTIEGLHRRFTAAFGAVSQIANISVEGCQFWPRRQARSSRATVAAYHA
jgi:hypothetical protein